MNGIKRIAALMLAAVLAAASFPGAAGASEIIAEPATAPPAQVSAVADGRAVIGARLVDNTTYLPLRSVCEDAGYSVSWDAAASTASVSGEDLQMTVTPGAAYLVANGRYIYLDKAAQLFGGTLYVPARPLATALGWNVEWNGIRNGKAGDKYIVNGGNVGYRLLGLFLGRRLHLFNNVGSYLRDAHL